MSRARRQDSHGVPEVDRRARTGDVQCRRRRGRRTSRKLLSNLLFFLHSKKRGGKGGGVVGPGLPQKPQKPDVYESRIGRAAPEIAPFT